MTTTSSAACPTVQFPDEIWQHIFSYLVRYPEPDLDLMEQEGIYDERAISPVPVHQNHLTVLMRVSSTFHNMAAPLLYKRIKTHLPHLLFNGVNRSLEDRSRRMTMSKSSLLAMTEHLTLILPDQWSTICDRTELQLNPNTLFQIYSAFTRATRRISKMTDTNPSFCNLKTMFIVRQRSKYEWVDTSGRFDDPTFPKRLYYPVSKDKPSRTMRLGEEILEQAYASLIRALIHKCPPRVFCTGEIPFLSYIRWIDTSLLPPNDTSSSEAKTRMILHAEDGDDMFATSLTVIGADIEIHYKCRYRISGCCTGQYSRPQMLVKNLCKFLVKLIGETPSSITITIISKDQNKSEVDNKDSNPLRKKETVENSVVDNDVKDMVKIRLCGSWDWEYIRAANTLAKDYKKTRDRQGPHVELVFGEEETCPVCE